MTQRSLFDCAPDLASYDLILINTSAGKDSAAMLDYVHERARKAGIADRLVVLHADLGEMEWPGTPELAHEHASHYGLPFVKVKRRQGDLLSHVEGRGMWPDAQNRYCTSQHKSGPLLTAVTALVSEINYKRLLPHGGRLSLLKKLGMRPVRILNAMGMRALESPARAKKPALARDEAASNGRRLVERWLPIHDWTLDEVWRRVNKSGLRPHPAYALGMSRASCSLCVLASKKDLVTAARLRPELAADYLRVEQATGHDFRLNLPMREIIRLADAQPDQDAGA